MNLIWRKEESCILASVLLAHDYLNRSLGSFALLIVSTLFVYSNYSN